MEKKKVWNSIISFVLVCALFSSTIPFITAVSAADEITGTESAFAADERIESEILTENDFSDANSTKSNAYQHSGAFYAEDDPLNSSNKVIAKTSSGNDLGAAIYLGMDYKDDIAFASISNEAIKVEAGATYKVEFDYYYDCSEWASTSSVYLSIGNTYKNPDYVSGTTIWTKEYAIDYDTNVAVTAFSTVKNSKMDKWERVNFSITIPSNYDTSNYPYLIIYNNAPTKNCKLYFDNIKVTKYQTISEELIAYHSYFNATVRKSGYDSVAQAMGADAYPTTDPLNRSNKLIRYRESHGSGFIIIGSDCEGDAEDISSEAIVAQKGKKYNIQFDYYATGTTDAKGTEIQFAVGEGTNNYSSTGRKVSWYETLLSLEKNSNVSTDGWVRNYKVSVTIPDNADFSNGDKLMLKLTDGGNKTTLYIDNIKVTGDVNKSGVSSLSRKELSFDDYSQATWRVSDSVMYDTDYTQLYGNIWPDEDPLITERSNVLTLHKFSTRHHQIIPGVDYSTKTKSYKQNVTNNYGDKLITPQPGVSYEILFDWYAPSNPQNGDIIVYAASGSINNSTMVNKDYTPTYDFTTEVLRIAASEVLPSCWQTAKAIVTIPTTTEISAGNILLLYVNANIENNSCNVCFDNIRITQLPQISVEMNVGSEHSSKIYAQGQDLSEIYPEKDGKAVMWFEDAGYSKPFSWNSTSQNTEVQHITLYGIYENADKPLVIGDLDGDSLVKAGDLSVVRNYLLETIERYDSIVRADANGDRVNDVRDLVRLKKMAVYLCKANFNINGFTDFNIIVPENDANYSNKNSELIKEYIGTPVADTADETECEIIIGNAQRDGVIAVADEDEYIITVKGKKVFVNAGSDRSLGAAILTLNGYITSGRSFTDGCIVDFKYIALEHPKDVVGIIPESIYLDDIVTTKESKITAPGIIENPAAIISLENGSVSQSAKDLGNTFATEIKNNKLADFEKPGDQMVHVSSFAIVNDVIYMTYYANDETTEENPKYQKARFVYAPYDNPIDKTYIDLQSPGDDCYGKTVIAVYDTILMQKDDDTLFLLWTANLSGNYYRLYRTYTISNNTLSPVRVNRFKVGDITNDFSITGIKSALTENEIPYKKMYADIGIMQKTSTRVENGETYYYTGAYCGTFTCIIKSKDMITWEYVAQPDFANYSEWENATYVIDDKCYYFVRQEKVAENSQKNYGFLTYYDLNEKTWSTPVLIEDVQSRADFIVYNNNLYLFYAPKNDDGIAERQHIGIVHVDMDALKNSKIIVHSYMGDSCFYPFVQYANGDTTKLYFSYTIWRKHIRLSYFNASDYLS